MVVSTQSDVPVAGRVLIVAVAGTGSAWSPSTARVSVPLQLMVLPASVAAVRAGSPGTNVCQLVGSSIAWRSIPSVPTW